MTEDAAIKRLAALAHPTRLRLFRILMEQAPVGLPAGKLSDRLGVSPSNLSAHLTTLAASGLITGEAKGRQRVYGVDIAKAGALIDYLVSDCCAGHPDVCGALPGQALRC